MSQEDPKHAKRRIETSALDEEKVAEINEKLHKISQIKSAKIKRRDIELDDESLPLDTVESMIGYQEQGDVFRNDLDLLFDRLQGEAEAPVFAAPSSEDNPAFEPLVPEPAAPAAPAARSQTPLPAGSATPIEASSLGGINFTGLDFGEPASPVTPTLTGERATVGAEEEDLPFEALERLMETPAVLPSRPTPAGQPLAEEGDEVDTWNDPED